MREREREREREASQPRSSDGFTQLFSISEDDISVS